MIKFKSNDGEGDDLMPAAILVEESTKSEEEEGPPQDGMSYLRQVVRERKRCADTVTADIDLSKVVKKYTKKEEDKEEYLGRTKIAPPSGCCPGLVWQREQVKKFSDVRLKISQHRTLLRKEGGAVEKVPDKDNEALWCHLMLGEEVWRIVDDSQVIKEGKLVTGESPRLNFVVAVPVYVCEHVLEYLVSWLRVTGWRPEFGPWIYSIMSRLEKPLTPEISSTLRELARVCSQIRVDIVNKSEEENSEESIAALNLFVCLVARYFDQTDLEDITQD